jgi:hypothetical protein
MHFTSETTSDGDEQQQQIKNLKQLPIITFHDMP